MSTPAKLILVKNDRKYIGYVDSDGYPDNILPFLIDCNTLEEFHNVIETAIFDEFSDPYYRADYAYEYDPNKKVIKIETKNDEIYEQIGELFRELKHKGYEIQIKIWEVTV